MLSEIQDWVRVQPLLMLGAMLLGLAGIVFTRGRVRAVLILLCGAGLLLFVVPSATANYNARYAIPVRRADRPRRRDRRLGAAGPPARAPRRRGRSAAA